MSFLLNNIMHLLLIKYTTILGTQRIHGTIEFTVNVMYIVVSFFQKKIEKEFLDTMKLANRSEHTFPVEFQKHETEVSNSQLYCISVVYFFFFLS